MVLTQACQTRRTHTSTPDYPVPIETMLFSPLTRAVSLVATLPIGTWENRAPTGDVRLCTSWKYIGEPSTSLGAATRGKKAQCTPTHFHPLQCTNAVIHRTSASQLRGRPVARPTNLAWQETGVARKVTRTSTWPPARGLTNRGVQVRSHKTLGG